MKKRNIVACIFHGIEYYEHHGIEHYDPHVLAMTSEWAICILTLLIINHMCNNFIKVTLHNPNTINSQEILTHIIRKCISKQICAHFLLRIYSLLWQTMMQYSIYGWSLGLGLCHWECFNCACWGYEQRKWGMWWASCSNKVTFDCSLWDVVDIEVLLAYL